MPNTRADLARIIRFLLVFSLALARGQVVRQSSELPVKDYLSSGRTPRDGRDQLYTSRASADAVRSFEVLSRHTPASALIFSALSREKQVGPTISTRLPSVSTLANVQGGGESGVSEAFAGTSPLSELEVRNPNSAHSGPTLQPRLSSSPSTKQLEAEIEQARNKISSPVTIPSGDHQDTRGSLAFGQEFVPVYTTPVPSFFGNNDAAFGYFSKFPFPLPAESGARSSQSIGFQSFQQNPPPFALKYESRNYEDGVNPYSNTLNVDDAEGHVYKNNRGADEYYQKSNEYQDYDTSYEKYSDPTLYNSNKGKGPPVYYKKESSEQNSYNPPLNEDAPKHYDHAPDNYANEPKGHNEHRPSGREQEQSQEDPDYYYNSPQSKEEPGNYYSIPQSKETPEYYYSSPPPKEEAGNYYSSPSSMDTPESYYSSPPYKEAPVNYYSSPPNKPQESENEKSEETQVSKPSQDDRSLPYIPPTKGVIGLKTLKDPNDLPWTPIITKELLELPEKYIREDLKSGGYVSEAPTPATLIQEQLNNGEQDQSEKGHGTNNQEGAEEESEEEGDDEEEEGEEGEEEEEEEDDEEEESERGSLNDGKNENTNQVPLQPPPQRDTFYTPNPTQQYEEPRPSQPGYYDEDQTLPPGPPYYPTSYEQDARNNLGFVPLTTVDLGTIPYESYDGNVKQTWTPIVPSESSPEENKSTPKYKSENGRWILNGGPILGGLASSEFGPWEDFLSDKSSGKERNHEPRKSLKKPKKYRGEHHEPVESKDLPVEHRHNRESRESSGENPNRESKVDSARETSREPEGIDYEPPPPPPDLDEKRAREHVSEREFPRKVPTRLRYPGGGLWARPAPGSGTEVGFVPKKVYTQTRRHNVVRHLPRAAAVAAASTAEELVNAPRLREVVSHKKIQEVYEEEGYEDTGYNHGGYKKHKESEVDTQKEDSEEYRPHDGDEGQNEEDAFEDHVAQLEAVPEGGDPAVQGSANRQEVVKATAQPRLKGQWKQQTTVTDEKSMAFLDEQGKGGILTRKHPPMTLGLTGKYVDVSRGGDHVIEKIKELPRKLETKEVAANVFDHIEKSGDQVSGRLNGGSNGDTINYFFPEYRDLSEENQDQPVDNYTLDLNSSQDQSNQQPSPSSSVKNGSGPRENTELPPILKKSQSSRLDNEINPISYGDNSRATNIPDQIDSNKDAATNKPKYSSRFGLRSLNSPVSIEVDSSVDVKSSKRERKSRDLTAFGIDQTDTLSQDEFTHPTVALRAIEDQLAQISTGSESPPRNRRVTPASDTGKRYKEIVRGSSKLRDDVPEERREKIFNVKVRDEVNIRHPFLPRDGSGDVQIDYVQTRTRMQPSTASSRGRKHFRESAVELAPTTEEPTTTTLKATTTKATSTTTTTTEYTPEDPSQVLRRLKSNPFLSSIFPDQEKHEDKITYRVEITSTTPKITTYRAKTTTMEPQISESPEETRERLKNNPFLTAVFLPKSDIEETKEYDILSTPSTQKPKIISQQNIPTHREYTQLHRGTRIRPIVVAPENSDIETDSSVKHVEKLTLAHYSGPSNGLLHQVPPMYSRQRMTNLAHQLNREGIKTMHVVVRRNADSERKEELINVASAGTTTEIPVDAEKYPYYYSPESVSLFKYSPLRYASNPKDIPVKTHGGMEFYESRDKIINCEEPTPPKNIVPKRQKDGEWNKDPQPKSQRLGKLGDQIDCLKLKYFGENPLDNPFFKEGLVGVPKLTTQSPDDGFGFYSDIVKNIKSDPESSGRFFEGVNHKRHVDPKDKGESFVNSIKKSNNNSSHQTVAKNSDGYKFEINSEKLVEESRISNKYLTKNKNKNNSTQSKFKKSILEPSNKSEDIVIKNTLSEDIEQSPKNSESITRPVSPIRLHQPSNVIISLKSKGTSNHPKIRLVKSSYSPHNINIKVMPMSTVGYLKSHAPLHVTSEPPKIPLPHLEQPKSIPAPLYILDTVSSEARMITQRDKYPTTVTYLTLNPEGRLIHQHIRTFVPVLAQPLGLETSDNFKNEETKPFNGEHVLSDDRRGEPKYRVKRNDLNDKYINSQDSKELTSFLLRKYADVLVKERQQSGSGRSNQNKINRPKSTDINSSKTKQVADSYPAKSSLVTENYPPNFYKFASTAQNISTEKVYSEEPSETENYPPNFRLAFTTQRTLSEKYSSDSIPSTENYPPNFNQATAPSKALGEFLNRKRPPYSSRYTAPEDPMHESSSTGVDAASESRDGSPIVRNNQPTRKPKVRFPKLTIDKLKIDKEKSKLLNLALADTTTRILTTTTTTTEPPPSTTTRMYKPRVVYKKEYGKPIEKVVNMFAALSRPTSTTESTTVKPTSEMISELLEPTKRPRKPRPRRLQQFERRRITKEEIFRTTYSPDEIRERSDKVDVYDSIYDHPDLRGPGTTSRRSRDSPAEGYQEILVYMVNPMTGVGEWKLMPVPEATISRMDERAKDDDEKPPGKPRRKAGARGRSRSSLEKESSETESVEDEPEAGETTIHSVVEEGETTPKTRLRGKTRRKHGRRKHKVNKNASVSEEAPISESSTPTHSEDVEAGSDESPSSTIHPKIILEPHKRKYFYAKI